MSPEPTCPDCGAPLPADAPRGLCPNCLMGAALSRSAGGPESRAALTVSHEPAGSSDSSAAGVLATLAESLGGLPRVLLRDTSSGSGVDPVVQPASPEMPGRVDRSAHLQLFGEIARGGMGAVLKGRDVDLGRDLAVKVLLERHRDQPDLVRRFVEEAQIAGQLQHPGVVPIYELGAFADRRPYFTMKLVKGRTLASVLAGRGEQAGDLMGLLSTLLQVGQTVAFAHARGVIHRDLKPSNVMIGGFGEVQVMDWGLAKVLPRGGAADDATAGRDGPGGGETVITTARGRSEAELSRAGSVLGTPAYMAPEQARGEVEAVDERADVFALGSMLCEVLTGRPAFTGRDGGEILRRAARGDMSKAWSRLDACGADAELIALTRDCLAPERGDRPRDASAFVERLGGYLASIEQRLRAAELDRAAEHARAEEAARRVAVERQRRRYQVGLAAALLVLSVVGGLSFTYWMNQRQARAGRTALALREAALLRDQAAAAPEDVTKWGAAARGLQAADRALAEGGDPAAVKALATLKREVQTGLRAAEGDAALLRELAKIRADSESDQLNQAYASAFRKADLDLDALSVDEAAALLRRRPEPVVVELVAFIDHWASERGRGPDRSAAWSRKLMEVARAADTDPYRNRLRTLVAKADLPALRELAADPRSSELPAPTAVLLGRSLARPDDRGGEVALLERAVTRHPGDVWINLELASALQGLKRREEALRYYTAARALRPDMAFRMVRLLQVMGRSDEAERAWADLVRRRPDHYNLAGYGMFLLGRRRAKEADAVMTRAVAAVRAEIARQPDPKMLLADLAWYLERWGKLDEAIAAYREAIRLDPNDANIHRAIGQALRRQGKPDEAIAAFREAIRIAPDTFDLHLSLGNVLLEQGRDDEAIAASREAIRIAPGYIPARTNLAIILNKQEKHAEAIAASREVIRLKPDYAEAHIDVGNLLGKQGKPDEAIAAYREAIRLKPDLASAHLNLGMTLMDDGKPDEAIVAFREAIRLKPDHALAHVNLGLALRSQAKHVEALDELRTGHELGSKQPVWPYPTAGMVREAERIVAVANRLPAILRGDDRPKDDAERLAFGRICYDAKRHAAAARFWAEAFENDPELAGDLRADHRYSAARAAALAGCGQGRDDPPPDDASRVRLRGQALDWLRADLTLRTKQLKTEAAVARRALAHWKRDSDLAGVRDPEALAALPEDERDAWRALWDEVDRLMEESGKAP